MEDGDSLYLQLHKLSSVATKEEDVEHILTSLWKTRGTGLPSQLKSRFQSLLNLPSISQLDPVLACLRSIIRKCVHENLSSDDLLKLFPPDLPLDLQTTLITLLHKYQIQWKQDDLATTEQHSLPRTSDFRVSGPPSFTAEVPTQLWSRQDDANGRFNHNDLGGSTSIITETAAPFSVQHHVTPLDNMQKLDWRFFLEKQLSRRGKEWLYPLTLENCNPSSANRVAIVTLKLQDYSKTSSGETEVKFQLSRDTVEAMLRSMTYINEQLSSRVGTTSGPAQKKQKQ
ncbi:COMM DOMAIN-CONTAINING PROTEIN 9 [Salix koriyanagi]|uniref:COMM DOMAIN-CONTAINING PROTEIN 9 n=1 Tax=Salix koriyanagi TaxID=2511006 RepID=A0A9Q1A478_9ROSI|nr:COMM DOMAIN-CONTAINING PROTEIN 9 [Salix koriyanagi]